LAYLLRVDPEAARPRIEAAMAARGKGYTACNHTLLVEVGKLHSDPLLEQIAVRSLADDDAEVADNAATFLRQFGSAAAEQPLWERFEQWSGEWRGREVELTSAAGKPGPNQWQLNLGESLKRALAMGRAWLADPSKLQRIAQLSVETMRREVSNMANQWRDPEWSITCYGPVGKGSFRCSVLQYDGLSVDMLKQKLAEFPQGSKFMWKGADSTKPTENQDVYRDMVTFAADQGLILRKAN
jgi:hypothetical protein